MDYEVSRAKVLATAQALSACSLTVGDSGNVSARVCDEGRLLLAITPHGGYYDTLGIEDIVVVDEEGEPVAGEGIPSVELGLHAAVYRSRPDVQAVIHAHPVSASAAAVLGQAIPPLLEDQLLYLGGQIEIAAYAPSGSEALAAGAMAALGDRQACLLANHGVIAVGKDLRHALVACQYLEKLAQVYLMVAAAGKAQPLPEAVVAEALMLYRMRG